MSPLAAFALSARLAACVAIDAPNDRILAADLARALPEWAGVAPENEVAIAPAPGIQRVLRIPDLHRLAAQWKIAAEPAREVCFIRPVAIVPRDRMLQAMHRSLPGAQIEILDASRMPAPKGVLDFPVSGLRPGYWYGSVTYGAGRRFNLWARVTVTAPVKRIVATADLKPGEPIEVTSVTQTTILRTLPDDQTSPIASYEEIAGYIPRRPIPAGTAIRKEWLEPPKIVQKGDTVKVEVLAGAARLELTAVAEAAGALGDLIAVQNPDSKRRFRARVEAKGKVSVKSAL
jgi:flagella basal body P-ring formation protein FlgA